MTEAARWGAELESVFARVAGRFGRADLRWRMRAYVRGLPGQAARKNGWQLTEWAGHHTPDGFQRLLNSSVWDADALRDDVRANAEGRYDGAGPEWRAGVEWTLLWIENTADQLAGGRP